MMRLALLIWLVLCGAALAQQSTTLQAPTLNGSITITTGNTYQLLLAANTVPPGVQAGARHSLTVQNNNTTTDNCFLIFGSNVTVTAGVTTTASTGVVTTNAGITAAKASILLTPGSGYTRYFPYIPNDALYVTCATAGDSVYLDAQ